MNDRIDIFFSYFLCMFIGFGAIQNQCLAFGNPDLLIEPYLSDGAKDSNDVGDQSAREVRDYIRLCVNAGDIQKAQQMALSYFSNLDLEALTLPENWFLFEERYSLFWTTTAIPLNMEFLIAHVDQFLKENDRIVVMDRIASYYRSIALQALRGEYLDRYGRDLRDFDRYSEELKKMPEFEAQQTLLIQMQVAKAMCLNDTTGAYELLADHIATFSGTDQQVIVPFLGTYDQKSAHPKMNEILEGVVTSGLNEDLIALLQDNGYVSKAKGANDPEQFDQENLIDKFGSLVVIPFFHPTKKIFWYAFEGPDHRRVYYGYDSRKGKYTLYDDARIDSLLTQMNIDHTYKSYEPKFDEEGLWAEVQVGGKRFKFDKETRQLKELSPIPVPIYNWGISPDKKYKVIEQDHNLYVQQLQDSTITQLTFDGSPLFNYSVADLTWIADHRFVVMRTDHRNVRQLAVINSLRDIPAVQTYEFELPGDTIIATQQLSFGDAQNRTILPIEAEKWKGQQIGLVKNRTGSGEFYFLRTRRTRDVVELCRVNQDNAGVEVVIHEESKPYINEDLFNCQVLKEDIILWSDRTGWGHYYRYDKQGHLKNAITKGEWTVGKIIRIDTAAKQLYFFGYGQEKDDNPNYQMLYRVGLNGKGLTLLTPTDAEHSAFVSPTGQLIVDSYSRIDLDPVVVIRDGNGVLTDTLEVPDLSKLYASGWRKPERFTIKAADGKTDLYGIMWKPFDFDPDKKYPIISQVYPGPQTETVWREFTILDRYSNTALAQRGFIVVCFGHRGGSPFRGKAYATYGYGNMRDYPLEDDKYGLEQLCNRYDFIDKTKIGITGHSGGGFMAVAALCTYPDFYKAAVSSSGNHDNYIYHRNWGELYNGIDEDLNFKVATNMELVKNLEGKLLLVTGESDQNVHPANTYKLVTALIQAGKDFDMLVLPGQGHHYEEPYKTYFEKRKRDFFEKAFKLPVTSP